MVLFSKCIFTYTVFFTSSIKLQLQLYPRHRHTGPSYRHYTTQNTPITKKNGSVSVWATMGFKSQPCSCMCKGFSQSPDKTTVPTFMTILFFFSFKLYYYMFTITESPIHNLFVQCQSFSFLPLKSPSKYT